jgi:protein arginine kinase activator
MVGCAECYRAFRARIIPLIRPATGRVQHIGRFPERLEAFKRLFVDREHYRQELDEAVELEDYERAALLRDKINEISGSHGEDG